MLLPLNEPTCGHDLRRITSIAGWLLDYAAYWPNIAFDRTDFRIHLKQAGFHRIINMRSSIATSLPTLFTLSQDERKKLRDAFYNDTSFCDHFDDPDFEFRFPSLDQATQEIGKAFLLLFYVRLAGSGFSDGIRGNTSCVSRGLLEKGYRNANEEMKRLCPACLGLLEQATSKTSLVDCEHFFPRKLYPPLIVHPNNLVFVCKACNHYHNDDDPIHHNPLSNWEMGGVRKTFVPYKRSGLAVKISGNQSPDELTLQFDLINPQKARIMLDSSVNDPNAHARVENFDRVYGLSERWGDLLEDIYNVIRESVRNVLEAQGEDFTRQNIEKQLKANLKTWEHFSYHLEGAYLKSQFLQWLQKNCLDSLYRELTISSAKDIPVEDVYVWRL